MAENGKKTIVLGGGLAGLSAAYHSGFAVYEQNDRPGGTAGSVVRDDFVFDFGIHVLHSKNPEFYRIMDEMGVELVTKTRSAWIYSHGKHAAYPLQVNTFHLPISLRYHCVKDFLLRKNHSNAANYEEWIVQNFGRGFAKAFLIPYAEKFWRFPPGDMTYEWVGPRVPQPRIVDVIKGAFWNQKSDLGPNSTFHYPSKAGAGYAGIAQAIASKIDNIHYRMEATSIDVENKVVFFNNGEHKVAYDHLISTIPLPELLKLLHDVPPEIQKTSKQLYFNSIAIVNLGVDHANISCKHWIHFPEKQISFFRISLPHNFCDGLNPPGQTTIQAEVSYDTDNRPQRDELLRRVRDDLIRVGTLRTSDHISFEDVVYLKYAYVIYNHHRKEAVNTIHKYLNNRYIYPCGRYGAWEYQWSDEAVLNGKQTAQEVLDKLKYEGQIRG